MEPFDQTPLGRVCESLFFPRRLSIRSDLTRAQYRFAISEFAGLLGRAPVVSDLTDDNLYLLIRFMEAQKLAPRTINERVGRLKTLWTWLAKRGHVPLWPTVERVTEPITVPRAWNQDELAALFSAARMMPGRVGPYLASVWWFGLLAVAWFTSERTTALLHLRWEMLQGNVLYVPGAIRKGGRKDMAYVLPDDVIVLLVPLSGHGEIFYWPYCPETFWLHFGKLLKLAGLPGGRRNKLQKIRRSHATWSRVLGQSQQNLGHEDPATTRRFYDDPGLGMEPPKLFRPWQ